MSLMTQVGMEFIARDRSRGGINSFNSNLRTTSNTVKMLSRNLLAIAGVGGGMYMLGSVLRSSKDEFQSFEKGLAKVSTQLDEHTMHFMPKYRQELLKLSATYGEAKTALTEGLFDVLSAEIDPSDALKVLEINLRSAKGGFTDTAIATKAAVRVMKAYNYEADQLTHVHDIMHATVKQGIMTFEEYAGAIGDILGTAAFLKVDFEVVGASMAAMTRSGLDAGKSIVALKNIFNQFQYPTEASRVVARELGFALDEASIQGAGLVTIIEKLSGANARQLQVLMPSMRGMAGFAGQLKNAAGLARGYALNLDAAGRMQTNFAKAAATDSFSVEQSTQRWSNFKILLGELTSPIHTAALKSLTEAMEANRSGISRWASDVAEGAGMIKKVLPIYWLYAGLKIPDLKKQLAAAQADQLRTRGPTQEVSDEDMWLSRMPQIEAAQKAGVEYVAVVERTNEQILADTRDQLASVRAMHDMTRMEKIQMLEDYRMAHFGHTAEIEESERLLNNEILAIQKSRVDAMKVYNAELREDMQNAALYVSEKYAEAAKSIESSMSSAFESMIVDGASFKDAMEQFYRDIARAFAKMVSDMIARAIMAKAVGVILGGDGGGGFSYGGQGEGFGSAPNRHSGWVPEGTPSFRGGRGLKSNEMAAIIEKDEMLVPNNQIAKGRRGNEGVNFQPQIKMVIVRDEREAYLEAMNSAEGEKVIVHKMLRNRKLLS